MKLLLTAALSLCALTAAAQHNGTWRHTLEIESLGNGIIGTLDLTTYLGYDDKARVAYRVEENFGVADSLVYRYDDRDCIEYKADYRGPSRHELYFYTYDEWEYDPYINDLSVWHMGHQNVDQEWGVYVAEKLAIDRDADGQITRIADYTPGDPDAGMPDLPISYVKTFTNTDRRLSAYRRESYMVDPVTEEAYLRLDEEWTGIVWEDYAGQITDPNVCLQGDNRLRSAHVYDEYYGYDYDLSVSYDGADYVATMDIPSARQRKVHTLTFTDQNGSFCEAFSTYRIDPDGTETLAFVEQVTERYDDHHNLTLQERALSKSTDHPEQLSVRQGKQWTYVYDATYDDWTKRTELQFYQNYDDDGPDGTYEAVSSISRLDWVLLNVADAVASAPTEQPAPSLRSYNLQGQRLAAPARGLNIERGRKVLR